ncbi:hypothetical protein QP445_13050, partial [Micrococcus luteus]|nr:hypothetical protein [Micrococcus luteus]
DGTSKLTLNVSDLKDYYVEYVPIELQNNYVETYLKEYDEQKIKLQMIQKRIEEELERLF